MPQTRRRAAALMLAGVLLTGGCTATQAAEDGSANGGGNPALRPEPQPLSLTLEPKAKARGVAPRDPVEVRAEHGKLTSVELVNPEGERVKGKLDGNDTRWLSAEPLGYGKQYTLTVRGVGDDGEKVRKRSRFTTVQPEQQVYVYAAVPAGNPTVGVGMPLSFTFTAPISDKKAAEKALEITTSKPVDGDFHWFNDSWVVWRPKKYWEPGTKVRINAEIYGRDLGGGVYGAQDVSKRMKIGEKLVAVADGKSHHMGVFIDGKRVKRMKIAMGRPGHNTPHGTYTVMSEHNGYTMDSSTYGVPVDAAEGYKITVDTAVRMSNSGIFYHSAPWSIWAQGNTNVSHGCINLSPQDAAWLMTKTKLGDVIEVRNSGGQKLEPTDGWSFWQMSWKEWQK